ncbi:MAG: sulfatase-like hydrolase/transferase [Candidatus Cryptobacteroides sp.]
MKPLYKSLLGFSAFIPALASARITDGRPNFLICVADDAAYDFWSIMGCGWVDTPNFDKVASEGILYTNCYTVNAKSAPSRACLLTGRNSWQLEDAANHICNFPQDQPVFPEVLAEGGYRTGYTCKGWGPGNPGQKDGKPRELTGKAYNSRSRNKATGGINRNDYSANFGDFLSDGEGPWCFWFGCKEPHRKYEYGTGISKGGKNPDMIAEVPPFWPDCPEVRCDMLDYALEVEHFDEEIGRMLAMLEENGQLENTVVIVTSDNGMPFPRCKGNNYEHSHHLPLAIMWKGGIASPGRVEKGFVSFTDLAPTILDLAGCDRRRMGKMSGKSLRANLTDASEGTGRDYVLLGRERDDNGRPADQGYPIRGIRSGEWLYLMNMKDGLLPGGDPTTGYRDVDSSPTKTAILELARSGADSLYWQKSLGPRPAYELYDIVSDPYCMHNLAEEKEYGKVRERLERKLKRELRKEKDPRMGPDGDIFDRYPYDKPEKAGVWEAVNEGRIEKPWLESSWVIPSDYEQFREYEQPFCLEAHRGLSNRYPENTILAFRKAAENASRYGGMETDVQMTSDGVLVCMHDKTIDRTTDGTGAVSDYTFEQLQQFWIDGGYGWDGQYSRQLKVPLFKDYLDICMEAGLKPYVELKLLTEDGIRKTVALLESYGWSDGYVLTSTNLEYLRTASEVSDMPLEYMKKVFTEEDIDGCRGLKNIVIRPSASYLTESIVKYCRKHGLELECYVIPVGDKVLVSRLRGWGVLGGTCNDFEGLGLPDETGGR